MSEPATRPTATADPERGPPAAQVQAMFARVAPRYDLANTVLSLGIHHSWRRRLVAWSGVRPGDAVLDCATGTGDLALAFKRAVGPTGRVIGTDFSPEMLAPAPAKARAAGLEVTFEPADVTRLPYDDDRFDVTAIAFGIRNVEDRPAALHELARVARPGGRVMVLEFGTPWLPGFRGLFRLYSELALPRLGGLVTGAGDAYRYLQDSSSKFPSGDAFAALMRATGRFDEVAHRPLSGGIAWLYRGVVA